MKQHFRLRAIAGAILFILCTANFLSAVPVPSASPSHSTSSGNGIVFAIFISIVLLFVLRDFFLLLLWGITSKHNRLQKQAEALEALIRNRKKRLVLRAYRHRSHSRWNRMRCRYCGRNIICIAASSSGILVLYLASLKHGDPTEAFITTLIYLPLIVLTAYILQRIIKGAQHEIHHHAV
jgi:hypothetical protein